MNSYILQWDDFHLELGPKTCIMGVLNTTPDSFSDGGQFLALEDAVAQGRRLVEDGAGILDIGGESTRPFSTGVSAQEEMDRVIPVIERLAPEINVPISIDSVKSSVVREALKAGAAIINDISAMERDPEMIPLAVEKQVPVILMHMKGTPADMQVNPTYEDFLGEVTRYLSSRMEALVTAGLPRDRIILDPGIGFGKTVEHNRMLIRHLNVLHELGAPLLMGPSRKSFIRKTLGCDALPPERTDRTLEIGNLAAVGACVMNGAQIVRVHDVDQVVPLVRMLDAIQTV